MEVEMFTSYYGYDHAMAVNQVPYSPFAASERNRSTAARVVKISWDELKNVKLLSALDDYQLDDIGIARSEIGVLARKSAEDPRGEHRSFN